MGCVIPHLLKCYSFFLLKWRLSKEELWMVLFYEFLVKIIKNERFDLLFSSFQGAQTSGDVGREKNPRTMEVNMYKLLDHFNI